MKRESLLAVVIAMIIAMAPGMLNAQFIIPADMKLIGLINFSNHQPGPYTLEMMAGDWNPRQKNGDGIIDFKGIIHGRAIVAENPVFASGRALRYFFPKEKIGTLETGAQIFGYVGEQEEIYFGLSLYLPPDFECGKETKIPPGIYGGWAWAAGGQIPDGVNVGPSIRAVIQYCQAKSYIYHLGQNGNNGDGGFYRNRAYGDKFAWKHPDGRPVIMAKGVKHDVMFHVKMNTPGRKDGIHRVWYDGALVLSLENLEFRKELNLRLNTVGVEALHGGNDKSYATEKDNTIDIGDCGVWVRK